MKEEIQLKLQAYLDGELPAGEATAVANLLAGDAEARELLAELTNTRSAIATHEGEITVPATREFYWSGIRREIERQEKSAPAIERSTSASILALLRRMLVPASGVAAVLLAVMLAGHQFASSDGAFREEVETTFEDSGAFTYRDYSSGTTLVWMDYPAENDFAEMDLEDILEFN
jgi:anti-sigma factor RsiW